MRMEEPVADGEQHASCRRGDEARLRHTGQGFGLAMAEAMV